MHQNKLHVKSFEKYHYLPRSVVFILFKICVHQTTEI